VVVLFFSYSSAAKEILVGGKTDAWKIPSSQSDSLNQWAGSSRFRIGDSLGKKKKPLSSSISSGLSPSNSLPFLEYGFGLRLFAIIYLNLRQYTGK